MLEAEELINAFFGIGFVVVLFMLLRMLRIDRLKLFFIGAVFLLLANIFTIVEGYVWQDFFNILEHAGYAAGGICFAVGCILLSGRFRTEKGG